MNLNPNSGYIAFLAALGTALISSLSLWLLSNNLKLSLILFSIVFVVGLVLFYLLLQFFIHRKITSIYKSIYRFKSQDETFMSMLSKASNDPISEVSDEVMKYMQENRKEISQLKEQEKFRREFIGNVSHELKTPIFSVQGYINTLLDGALEDKDVNRKFLQKAERGIDRLAEIVEDLTSITEFQAGKISLKKSNFEIEMLVQEAFEMLQVMANSKGIKLHFVKSTRSSLVYADKHRILQVLTNLVVNAIKYGKPEGNVWVNCRAEKKKIFVEVKDDGEGIPNEHLNRLFERFYRIDEHRNSEEGGTGLGLAIVKHIIEAHAESIDVHSKVGEGSSFEFSLSKP